MKKLVLLLTIGVMSLTLAQTTFLCVEPETTIAQPGDSFRINFDIADVESLFGWQIYLHWDPSVLHLKRVEEGPFLSENGQKPTIFTADYDDTTNGYVLFLAILMSITEPPTSGSGTLAYGFFSVKQNGSSPLNFILDGMPKTYLIDNNGNQIPFTKRDGYFTTGAGIEEKIEGIPELGIYNLRSILSHFLEFNYFLRESRNLKLDLYDITGKRVKTFFKGMMNSGWHEVKEPLELPCGIYFLRFEADNELLMRKIIVVH